MFYNYFLLIFRNNIVVELITNLANLTFLHVQNLVIFPLFFDIFDYFVNRMFLDFLECM